MVQEQVKACVTLDRVILFLLLLLLWALFTVPFILFYSSPQIQTANVTSNGTDQMFSDQMFNVSMFNVSEAADTNISCYQDFYFEESKNYCVPDCYSWTSYSQAESTAVDVVIIISCCVATISTITVLVISCIRRNTVLKFPSILVFYMSLTTLMFYASILIGYLDRYRLYCTSRDLQLNFLTPTPYCLLSGVIYEYQHLQLLVWWLSHVISIFFMIFFPLQAKTFLASRKVHFLHTTIIIAGILAPTMAPLVTLLSDINEDHNPQRLGYRVISYPPQRCLNVRATINFYTFNVPSNIMLTTGVSCLSLIVWKLYKQRQLAMVKKLQVSTAEKKILISFGYFTLLQISISSLSVYFSSISAKVTIETLSFFDCARYSVNCLEPDLAATIHPVGIVMPWVIRACLPMFLLAYVIDCEKLKHNVKKTRDTIRNESVFASSKAQV